MMGFSIMKVQPFPERDLVVVPLTLQPKVLKRHIPLVLVVTSVKGRSITAVARN